MASIDSRSYAIAQEGSDKFSQERGGREGMRSRPQNRDLGSAVQHAVVLLFEYIYH